MTTAAAAAVTGFPDPDLDQMFQAILNDPAFANLQAPSLEVQPEQVGLIDIDLDLI